MENLNGSSLKQYPKELNREQKKILCGKVKTMHKNNIIHNDLHNSNIYISDKDIPYIIDFGLAQKINKPKKYMSFLKGDDVKMFFGANMRNLARNNLIKKSISSNDVRDLRLKLKRNFDNDTGKCNKASFRKIWFTKLRGFYS